MFYTLNEDGGATPIHGSLSAAAEEYTKWRGSEVGQRLSRIGRDDLTWNEKLLVVSTVFLGMTHSDGMNIHLFETMVFDQSPDCERKWNDIDSARYTTRDEAIAGHAAMVAKWRAKLEPETDLIGTPIITCNPES